MRPDRCWLGALVAAAALVPLPVLAAPAEAGVGAGVGAISALTGLGSADTPRIIQLLAGLTLLSLAPGLLMTVTAFTRIIVALSLLRTGFGAPGVPPNPVLIALALFLTAFVMAPTVEKAWSGGIVPYGAGQISEEQAWERTSGPFREFMMRQVRPEDLQLFAELSPTPVAADAAVPMAVLAPAFMISELRRAFEIGFLLLLPFLIIDLAVAAVLMAMGMMMLPPPTISLPCKIIFFVLVDGWALIAGSLIRGFG